jgi:hypothetical protein
MDAYARGLRRMPTPPLLMSEFVGMASGAPTYFLDLMDDDVESVAPASATWCLATICVTEPTKL